MAQTTTTAFNNHVKGSTRKPVHQLGVAWQRTKDSTVAFAIVGTSTVDGTDIVQGEFTEITESDLFAYTDESQYVIDMDVSRKMSEPLGGLNYAIAKLKLENTSNRFTATNTGSGVSDYILPNRPVKIWMGFEVDSVSKLLPILYGTTEYPRENKDRSYVDIDVNDYISYINDYPLQSAMYVDQRSDQIIADILGDIGFTATQYTLSSGLNTIPFAWFKKDIKAGEAIREICEAEGAVFYQDEFGDLVFKTSRDLLSNTSSVWTIRAEDVVSWEYDPPTKIINRVIVRSKPREVTDNFVEIWKLGSTVELQPAEVKDIWANFDDPINSFATLTATIDYTANTEFDGSGTDVTSSISISTTNFTQDSKLTITNSSGGVAYITFLRLRGKPAVITSEIEEIYEDTTSQANYGVQLMEIENNYISDSSFAYYIGRDLVRRFSEPKDRIRIEIPLTPQLQIRDVVTATDPDIGNTANYRVVECRHKYGQSLTELVVRALTGLEALDAAIVGTSTVDGDDVVWL